MNPVQVRKASADTGRGPTPNLWHDCPVLEFLQDPGKGYRYFDDFLTYDSTATTVRNEHGLPTFEGTTEIRGTAATTAATAGGMVELFTTADNEGAALEVGGAAQGPFMISNASGDARKLWFECRIKNSLIDNIGGWFVGLAAPGSGGVDFIDDAGTDYADVSFIGFTLHEDDGDSIDFTYQANGNAFSNLVTGIAVPVADTFIKLGFVYNPGAVDAEKIALYVNGVKHSTFVTTTLIDTATFPEAEGLGLMAAVKSSDAADRTLTMDWWGAAQLA